MKYIEEYHENDRFAGVYLCKDKKVLKTKNGKTYYSVQLQDKTASCDAKVWELTNGIDDFEPMDYIQCEGQVTSYQGSLQMNLIRIRRAQEGEYDPSDYVPTTKKDIPQMYQRILTYIESITEPHLKKLLEIFFVEDKKFATNFKKHSAAKSIHHAFLGGLLQHTLAVTDTCQFFATQYPILNRDLLITAALFHDMGKLEEISAFPENVYTDEGQLLGHIYMGTEQVSETIAKIDGFPVKLGRELKHCILAHHGKLEYGSPKVPALMEAMALFLADFSDSKLQTVSEILDNDPNNDGWLGYNRLLESNLRRATEATSE